MNIQHMQTRLNARWEAVKAISGDHLKNSYEKAGLTFERDGRFSRVAKDGVVVAFMTPTFNRRELHDTLISLIQDDAKRIGEIFEEAYKGLQIPTGYSFMFELERDVRDIASFHGKQMSAFIRLVGDDVEHLPNLLDVELRVFLDTPRAHVFANKGPRFFGQNVSLLKENEPFIKAESYDILASNLVSLFNEQILERWAVPTLDESIERMKQEIVKDVKAGRVPADCSTFSDLHNAVDANCYGGFCEDDVLQVLIKHFGGRDDNGSMPDGLMAHMNHALNAIDHWIKEGGIQQMIGAGVQLHVANQCNAVAEGVFSGRVVSVKDGMVVQKINRHGEVAIHDLNKLSDKVNVDDVVDIKYQNGVGKVSPQHLLEVEK